MNTRQLISCICFLAAGCSTSQSASEEEAAQVAKLVQDYAPPFCYLVADQLKLDLKQAVAMGVSFKATLPPECDDGVPIKDNASWASRLAKLRADSAAAIVQRGFMAVPRNVEVAAADGCGVNRPLDGASQLRQTGYDIQLALAGAPENIGFKGAIMENHIVFLMIGGALGNDPHYSEPLFGDWVNDSMELRSIRPGCTISIKFTA